MYGWSLLLDKKTSRKVGTLGNSHHQRCDTPFYCVAPRGMSLSLLVCCFLLGFIFFVHSQHRWKGQSCSLLFLILGLGEVFLSYICFGQNIETMQLLVCFLSLQILLDILFMF